MSLLEFTVEVILGEEDAATSQKRKHLFLHKVGTGKLFTMSKKQGFHSSSSNTVGGCGRRDGHTPLTGFPEVSHVTSGPL